MVKLLFLFIVLLIRTNSQIIENPIFLFETKYPFALSTDDEEDDYYIITEGKSLQIDKDTGEIIDIKNNTFIISEYVYILDKSYTNYLYNMNSNNYYEIIYNPFISYQEIAQPNSDFDYPNMIKIGVLQDNNFIIYGYNYNFLIFLDISHRYSATVQIYYSIKQLTCKLIENEIFICAMIKNGEENKIYIETFKYINSQGSLEVNMFNNYYNYYQSNSNIYSFSLYDTDMYDLKLLCLKNEQNMQCKFFEIAITDTHSSFQILGDENLVFEIYNDITEKNCYITKFNEEYLFCCALTDYIKCHRINLQNYNTNNEFQIAKSGSNSFLTIKSSEDHIAFFFMNYNYYTKKYSVYEYFIYKPYCQNKNYELFNSLNENKSNEEFEKLKNLFTVMTNKYYFKLIDPPDELGYFTLNGEIINQRTLIRNNDYIFDFNVTNKNIIENIIKTINYIVSVEDGGIYTKQCQIKLTFKVCYHSCENCSKDITESDIENHNCIICKINYYPTKINNGNCYSLEEKKINWYFDSEKSEFGVCHENCRSCSGSTEFNCLSCTDGLYLDNNNCKNECPQGYNPIKIYIDLGYYFKCQECHPNCETCLEKGDEDNMKCKTCKENHIRYENNCYSIVDNSVKSFSVFENLVLSTTSCFEKFNLYIKEDSNECIPLPREEEGYYISNSEVGLLSKCHDNCLTCENGPIKDDSGNILNMGCFKCKDANNSQKTMIKFNNSCFNILNYNEFKIIFNISDISQNNHFGTCKQFGKAIYYGQYECIDKPNNSFYVLNDENENTGVIKNCNEACNTCLGEGDTQKTNCLECAQGYIKSENSDTHCIINYSKSTDFLLSTTDNIYYQCYQNCKLCNESYNPLSNEMNCLECIDDYYFIYSENNCYNLTLLQENKYYFDTNDKKFHKCYNTCSECLNSEPNEMNHSCISCINDYYFLENTNNCYDINLTEKGYYLEKNMKIFKICYINCKTCTNGYDSNSDNHNCIECADNYYKLGNGLYPNNCYDKETIISLKELKTSTPTLDISYDKSEIINYNNNTFIFKTEDYLFSCPNGTFLFSLNNSCLNSCPHNYEISNNKCVFNSFDTETTLAEFKNQISSNITSYVNSFRVITGANFLAMVLSSDNMDPQEQLKNGISAVDLGNCTNAIKNKYKMKKEENLIVVNTELKSNESQNMKSNDDKSFILGKNTKLEIYDYSGKKLDLKVCQEEIKIIKYLGDIDLDKLDMESAKNFFEQGIDVFNAADDFFNDLCHHYDDLGGKDIIINDRRNDIYQNATFCQEGCRYSGISYELNAANCLCNTSYLQEEERNITLLNSAIKIISFKTISKIFLENLFDFNFGVLRCYNLVINTKILINNIGFYCLSSMFFLQIIFAFVYLSQKLISLKKFLLKFQNKNTNKNQKNRNINIINNNNFKNNNNNNNNCSKKKLISTPPIKRKNQLKSLNILNNKKQIIGINHFHQENRNKMNVISKNFEPEKIKEEPYNLLNPQSSKSKINSTRNLFISQNIENNINIQIPNIYNKKNILSKDKKEININKGQQIRLMNNNNNIYNIKSNKKPFLKKKISNSGVKDNSNKLLLTIYDIQDMDYEEAIIYDKRSCLKIYWGFLVDSQIILGTFCTDNYLDLFVIKLSFFICTFQISFFLNALFYTDEYISDAYHNDGILDFFSGLPKSIYSFVATLITTNLLRMLSSSKSELIKLIKDKRKYQNYLYLIQLKLNKLSKKLIIYFIIVYLFSIFFSYYVSAFCAVYRNSQKYLFLGCLESFGTDCLVAFAICIFLSILRYISVRNKIKCFYVLANIIGTFL